MSEKTCPDCGNPLDPRSIYCVHCEQLNKAQDDQYRKSAIVTKVVVTDFNMPFWSMVGFMVKAAIASVPAMIILMIIFSIVNGILAGLLSL